MKIFFLVVFLAFNAALCAKSTKSKIKLVVPKLTEECKLKINCSSVEDPHCMRLKHKTQNRVVHIAMINKCELEYLKCHKDYEGTVVPMKYCGHQDATNDPTDATVSTNDHIRSKRHVKGSVGKRPKKSQSKLRRGRQKKITKKAGRKSDDTYKDTFDSMDAIETHHGHSSENRERDQLIGEDAGGHRLENVDIMDYTPMRLNGPGTDPLLARYTHTNRQKNDNLAYFGSRPNHFFKDQKSRIGPHGEMHLHETVEEQSAIDQSGEKQDAEGIMPHGETQLEYETDERQSASDRSGEQHDAEVPGHTTNFQSSKEDQKEDKERPDFSDSDEIYGKVHQEQYEAECPTFCPSRHVMVCSKCRHGIYQTFLSVCHMRMYACNNKDDSLQLVARKPCVLSAPYLDDPGMEPLGGVSDSDDDDDRILRFIYCRDMNRLDEPPNPMVDFKCQFGQKKNNPIDGIKKLSNFHSYPWFEHWDFKYKNK